MALPGTYGRTDFSVGPTGCLRHRPGPVRPGRSRSLAELATLHAGLAKQLTVLLLRHPLATLLDDRAHTGALRDVLVESTAGPPRPERQASTVPVTRANGARRPGTPVDDSGRGRRRRAGLAGVDVRAPQVLVHRLLGHPEAAAHTHGRELTVVHQAVHRHLRDTHRRGDLGHGEELHP